MAQWGQGQPGYQYPQQTGFPNQNSGFQQQNFGQLAPQPTGFPGQRPGGFQQPQQTGFPGGGPGLLPQQTGFPGMGGGFQQQQQQRPPVPPVPPIPSQFQQPQQPQQTGFPGQGGGMQPLVPQATGFVDPRLVMMSSTFLPANMSPPYNPAGAPQLLQPQQQLGGLSLQQSFQQHNQEVKGTSAPRVPWALSKAEKKSYDQIFRAWDTTGTGFIDGATAIEVFGQSGLDRNDLARVWTLADGDNRGKLNIAEFHVAMGLIYRKLNGNNIPDELPAELKPPSSKDLDGSVDFVKGLLRNEPSRAKTPSASDGPVSKIKDRSFYSTGAGAGGRQDATVYRHSEDQPAGGFYTPRSRHVDRSTVRSTSERDSPSADLSDMKRQLESTASMLDRATAESASRTAEDEALDREMDDLKWRVKRVQEDLDYISRGPRSSRADEDRRRLERELLQLLHERVPEVERKLKERDERKERQKREWDRERDRRNETFGRFDDRDRDRDRGYSSYSDRYDRDRDRDRDHGRDRDHDFDRDRDRDQDYRSSYRERSRSRDRYRDRARSPPTSTRSPAPPPPPAAPPSAISKPPPAPPVPTTASPAPSTKNMSPAERQAFIRAEAQRRMQERMAALGVAPAPSASPKLDSSVEDRLAREKKEAEEKARDAERMAEEREKSRREKLESEKAIKEGRSPTSVSSPATTAAPPAPAIRATSSGPTPKAAPPPPKPRAPAPPPPRSRFTPARTPSTPSAPPAPPVPVAAAAPPPPAPPAVDPEEQRLLEREAQLRKQREDRLARLRQLEQEEEEERKREEESFKRRQEEANKRAREAEERRQREEAERQQANPPPPPPPVALPAPTSVPPPPPPPPPPVPSVASPADKGKNNPFSRLMTPGATPAAPSPPAVNGGGNNPFFKPQPAATASPVPPAPKSPAPKTSYNTAPADSDTEGEWGHEKDDDDDSSEDELDSSRDTRNRLAQQLFGSILPPARPQSAAGGTPSVVPTPPPPPPSAPPAPPAPAAPAAPPPPFAPAAPPPPAMAAPAPAGDRGALLNAIQGGARLRKAVTNDRSSAPVSGRVIGDAAPPPHVNIAPRPVSPPSPPQMPPQDPHPPPPALSEEDSRANNRQSVDWYAGLAADHGAASREPSGLGSMREEDESEPEKEGNGHAAPVPHIQVASPEESDPLDDVDLSTEYRVRSLYPYEGQRAEDLSFAENLVLTAHPSKTGGDWWHGTVVRDGKSGFFPKTYVERLEIFKARALYAYTGGNADELPFAEGDTLSIVDRSEPDWWKAEQGGVIFIVPAAYLEVVEAPPGRSNFVEATAELDRQSSTNTSSQSLAGDEGDDEDTTDSEYHSFSDSDSEESDVEQTEEERKLERETRAMERQMVLEAAGLVVKQDATRRPPPRPARRKSTVKRHRPPPAVPRERPTTARVSDPPAPPPPEKDLPQPAHEDVSHLDDAFERYEAFKQSSATANRMSVASVDTSPVPPSPSSAISFSSSALSIPPRDSGSEKSSYSGLLHFLGRSRTPTQDGPRTMPTISAPILNTSSSGGVSLDGTPIRENSPAFGSSWASLVDKTALEGLPERERKRQEAIFELIATEAAYVRDLQLIVEIFYSSMISLLEPKAITVIFANVEDLLLTNTTFLSSLEERQRSCRLYIDQIGDILDKHMINMRVYGEYCVNQGPAIKVLQTLRDQKPELASHLQKLREDPVVRSLDLSSYLLVPMQRITRYPLLIKQILHYTEPDQDRAQTERALRTAEKTLGTINESIRDQEGRARLRVLSQNLWIGQGRLDLTAPTRSQGDRKLLKEGLLSKAKSGRKLRAFLCNDIFVLTDEQAKTLYRMPIPLSEIRVADVSGGRDDLAFQLSVAYPRGGDKIALRASSARECHLWMADIDIAGRKCRDADRRAAQKRHA
ncbi:hypothetical protein FA95DRAFT_1497317 [Auriscalpium vulgare]|uniref:Uncharacterized protein n=1 Tax=Auriscalpium vulgare TaxID=40419 RepID=A0ACB8RJ67_9AGAM|nr:hypothetical protein FA95DRAFT_1497317 [Auriscalpium vulgare]